MRSWPLTKSLAAAVAALTAGGCALMTSTEAGHFRPTKGDADGNSGVAAVFRAGHYMHSDSMSYGLGLGMRTKLASELKQYSISADVTVSPRLRGLVPFLRTGANLYQAESLAGEFGYGMFSPYAEAGLMVQVARTSGGTRIYLSGAATAEYALRFTSQPHRGYWGFVGGIAIAAPPGKPEKIRFAPPKIRLKRR